ncbi:MAG: hypothetical protein AVDCRST_MAG65-1831 [uncultured Solirubrobacteraceae bacterium]|uniref:Uncharacterized protein n=1 Tax=uncultured Solirubrobacteraceae bacterium TaxID=1162706 RepID=A0A6J4S2H7_9ACTN|nr:MAG: hypothetical protein AVDCRST_MAG65-1831 [uncultured Solirubrobacteraceae bacterium]
MRPAMLSHDGNAHRVRSQTLILSELLTREVDDFRSRRLERRASCRPTATIVQS